MHNNDHGPDGPEDDSSEGSANAHADDETAAIHPQQRSHESLPDDGVCAKAAAAEASLIEESLHDALSDLEQILNRHESPAEFPHDGDRVDATADERVADNTTTGDAAEQYIIPLLDEVVIAGPDSFPLQPAVSEDPLLIDDDDEPALRKRLAERLASEIEIIMQDRIEAALETAREEIRDQVRNHLDITLPEIVEELHQLRRRPNANPER